MSGPYGKHLDQLFADVGIADMQALPARSRGNAYMADIQRFVEEYQSDALCDYLPGRKHDGFGEYESTSRLQDPIGLGKKLKQLSTRMDMLEKIVKHKITKNSN
jgi:hypothetical protein